MIDVDDICFDKRYYCYECGLQQDPCELKGHICFDRFPHISIQSIKARWYHRSGHWIADNFVGILGFFGVDLVFSVLFDRFGFTGKESIFLCIGSGFLCAYAFLMARDH
jgi:hypothetical protein